MTPRAFARLVTAHPVVGAGVGPLVHAAAIGPAAPWSIQLFDKDPA